MALNWFRRSVFTISPFTIEVERENETAYDSSVLIEYRWKVHTLTRLRYTAVIFEVKRHQNAEGAWVFEPSKEIWTSPAKETPMEARMLAGEFLGPELTKERLIADYTGPPIPITFSVTWDF